MKRSQAEGTTAKNLEEKFGRGEDVLDYFDASKARLLSPKAPKSAKGEKGSSSYSAKRESRNTVVREEPVAYPSRALKTKRRK